MTFPNSNAGPATQTTGNVAGGPYGAWNNTAGTGLIGPTGTVVSLGTGAGGVALFDGINSITSGTAQFSNANGVTFGIVGQTITASVPAVGGAQTGISGLVVSNTTYTSGTVTFQNANGISFGSSGANGISASYTVPTQSVQTQAAGNIGATGFTTTTTNGVVIVGTNNTTGLTLAVPPYITTYVAQTVQPVAASASNGSFLFSTLAFSNANNVTFGTSAGSIVTASVGAGGVQTGISGIIVSNTTYTSGTVSFSNANGISFGSSAGQAITASYTVPTVPALSIGVSNIGNTLGNTGIYSGQAVFAGANITLSVSSAAGGAQTITVSGPTQSVQTLGVYASSQTTGATSSSNIDARSFTHVGQGIISIGVSAGSLLFSATTVAQTNQTIGLYAVSQTTGGASSTTLDARTVSINPYGAMSAGFNAGSIQLSVPGTSSLVGTNGISVSTNGSTITVSGVPQSVYIVGNTTGQSSSSYYTLGALTITAGAGISIGWSNGSLLFSA